jgi:hypothetical protein
MRELMIARAKGLKAALDLADLPGKVEVVNPDEVLAYLGQYPELVTILPDLCARTRGEFGVGAQLLLELKHDFESFDPHLVLCVRVADSEQSLMPRLDTIDAEFDERLTEARGWLGVTTDHRPPQTNHAI